MARIIEPRSTAVVLGALLSCASCTIVEVPPDEGDAPPKVDGCRVDAAEIESTLSMKPEEGAAILDVSVLSASASGFELLVEGIGVVNVGSEHVDEAGRWVAMLRLDASGAVTDLTLWDTAFDVVPTRQPAERLVATPVTGDSYAVMSVDREGGVGWKYEIDLDGWSATSPVVLSDGDIITEVRSIAPTSGVDFGDGAPVDLEPTDAVLVRIDGETGALKQKRVLGPPGEVSSRSFEPGADGHAFWFTELRGSPTYIDGFFVLSLDPGLNDVRAVLLGASDFATGLRAAEPAPNGGLWLALQSDVVFVSPEGNLRTAVELVTDALEVDVVPTDLWVRDGGGVVVSASALRRPEEPASTAGCALPNEDIGGVLFDVAPNGEVTRATPVGAGPDLSVSVVWADGDRVAWVGTRVEERADGLSDMTEVVFEVVRR